MATRPGGAPAFGAATDVTPKFVSPADSAARWSAAHSGQAFFAYSTNYLIDVHNALIVDVEPTTAIREAEVLAAKRMIERAMNHFRCVSRPPSGPQRLRLGRDARLTGLRARLRPHVTVFDKSARQDGTSPATNSPMIMTATQDRALAFARHGLNSVAVADPCRFAPGCAKRLRNAPVHAA